jgi:PAS domain S-box-containing protein
MSASDSFALFASVKSVRELLQRKLGDGAGPARDELEAGLQEIETLWEELRLRADELASERQRYSEFFDYAPDAYLVTDSQGSIRDANLAAAELFGARASALRGKPIVSLVAEAERREFRNQLLRAGAQLDGEVRAWRSVLQPREGTPLAVHIRVRAMPVADGGLAPLCWLLRRG